MSDNLAIEVYHDGEWQPAENLELHLGPAVHELPDGAETITRRCLTASRGVYATPRAR